MEKEPMRSIANAIVELEAAYKMFEGIGLATERMGEIIRQLRESYDDLDDYLTVK